MSAETFRLLPMHSTAGPARHSGGEHRRKCLPTNYTRVHDTVLRRPVESALGAGIRVVDSAIDRMALTGPQCCCLTKRRLHEPGLLGRRVFPTDDRPGVGIDDERDIDEHPRDQLDVGEVGPRRADQGMRSRSRRRWIVQWFSRRARWISMRSMASGRRRLPSISYHRILLRPKGFDHVNSTDPALAPTIGVAGSPIGRQGSAGSVPRWGPPTHVFAVAAAVDNRVEHGVDLKTRRARKCSDLSHLPSGQQGVRQVVRVTSVVSAVKESDATTYGSNR
jgi:hypothetical protein